VGVGHATSSFSLLEHRLSMIGILRAPHMVINLTEGENDGVVSVASAKC
jgi:hypothetical protein